MNQIDRDNDRFIHQFVKCRLADGNGLTIHLSKPSFKSARRFSDYTLCRPGDLQGLIPIPKTEAGPFDPARDLAAICPGCVRAYEAAARARLGIPPPGERITF